MDEVKPLSEHDVTGRFKPTLEASMRTDRSLVFAIARALVTSHFPETVASEVLTAVGLDPTLVLRAPDVLAEAVVLANDRRRNSGWRSAVLQAWDRQCAFCGHDGQLAGAPVGVEAAHVRWFAFEGARHAG
jgi:putative restriction endonuclease